MFLKTLPTLIISLLISFCIQAQQETTIIGKVTEIGSNSGIPFVNIYFKNSLIGTRTDFEGNYTIKTLTPKDSIFVSLIGYQSERKPVKKGQAQVINFHLSRETLNLSVVEILPGVNPALRIIKNTINNKEKHNKENLQSVQYLSYTKQQVDVDNVTDRMRKRKLFDPITAMWDSLDAMAGDNQEANLPVSMSEVISEIYTYKEAKKKHEEVKAVQLKFVGMKDGSALSKLMGTDFQNYNFCNNSVTILDKDFLSPIATNAGLFYNYYLIDSIYIDSIKCYKIDVRPKNKKDLVFTGTLWITDSTFAIKQLDLAVTKDVNFNLVLKYGSGFFWGFFIRSIPSH